MRKSEYNTNSKFKENFRIGWAITIAIILFFISEAIFSRGIDNFPLAGVFHIFNFIGLEIIYIIIMMIIFLSNNKNISLWKVIISFILSGILISIRIFGGAVSISRWGFLIYTLACLSIISKLYTKYTKLIIYTSIPVIMVGIFSLTNSKFGTISDISIEVFIDKYLSVESLDAYFQGINGITYGIMAKYKFSNYINFNTLLTDLFSAIPIISNLFDANINSTPTFYHLYMQRTDLIIPTISQGYIHFGIVGAPILSILCTYLVLFFDNKMRYSNDIFSYFQLNLICIWCSLFMAINVNIITEGLWKRLIFLIVMYMNYKFILNKSKLNLRR